jgi:hypothetical protein
MEFYEYCQDLINKVCNHQESECTFERDKKALSFRPDFRGAIIGYGQSGSHQTYGAFAPNISCQAHDSNDVGSAIIMENGQAIQSEGWANFVINCWMSKMKPFVVFVDATAPNPVVISMKDR